jgi:hypothetical protein
MNYIQVSTALAQLEFVAPHDFGFLAKAGNGKAQ